MRFLIDALPEVEVCSELTSLFFTRSSYPTVIPEWKKPFGKLRGWEKYFLLALKPADEKGCVKTFH